MRRVLIVLLLAVLTTPSLPAAARKAADVPPWGFFGVTDIEDPLEGMPPIGWSRVTGLHWPKLELPPGSGRYSWVVMDERVKRAQQNGYNLVFVLKTGNSPGISDSACYEEARKSKREPHLKSCPLEEKAHPAWQRFVGAVIERYDGDGNADMPGLADGFTLDIQIENEAGSPNYWYPNEPNGVRAAKALLPVVQLADRARDSANPATRLIAPGIIRPNVLARCETNPRLAACSRPYNVRNRDFTVELLQRHLEYFDAVDVHFFNYFHFDPAFIPDGMRWVREQMGRAGREKPIYSLEWTGAMMLDIREGGHEKAFVSYFPFPEAANAKELQRIYQKLSDPRHAKYRRWFELEQGKEFPKLFTTMLAHGVERMIHVPFHDYIGGPRGWNSVWWNWQGMVRYEGTRQQPRRIRKPASYSYELAARKLAGFRDVQVVSAGREFIAYKFQFAGRKPVGVAWSEGGERTVDLSKHVPAARVQVTSLPTGTDRDRRSIVPETKTVNASAVPLTDTPAFIEAADDRDDARPPARRRRPRDGDREPDRPRRLE